MEQLEDGVVRYAPAPQERDQFGVDHGIGFWHAAIRQSGVIPAAVVTDEELIAQTGVQRAEDEVGALGDRN
ncbi:hypothetical protein D3C87_2116370 [compost metagenome]